jgi:hypothetical protein
MSVDPAFLELVQLHERTWGTEQYLNRPTLAELMSARIVVMWVDMQGGAASEARRATRQIGSNKKFTLECFDSPQALNDVLASMVLLSRPSRHGWRKISRVFIQGKPIEIEGVRLVQKKE